MGYENRGESEAFHSQGSLYFDIDKVVAGGVNYKPYEVVFHEGGHNIDYILRSQQNLYYEKNNPKYNRNVYPEDNYVQNNYNENYINKSTNRKLIKGGKQKIRSVSNYKNIKKKRNNNYVNLDIINCETQYPLMTCFNADPYNRLQKKRLIQNYNNINNYANNNIKKNNEIIVSSNEEKMNSIRSENLFNNQMKNKNKNTKLNNSCYNK